MVGDIGVVVGGVPNASIASGMVSKSETPLVMAIVLCSSHESGCEIPG